MTFVNRSSKFLASCAVASILPILSPAAYAQQQPAENAAEGEVGEIIVTAQRRSENVMKVPVSVTVISGDALTSSGTTDLRGVTKLAPSLQASQDNQFSIRGIGTATYADTVESS
ncbi:MAG: TonB-dependent receptor, partial [Alphaproteobacteria bacterium]|nr:TonB-dependent receptor [Alphaproteobacteria bacterium]